MSTREQTRDEDVAKLRIPPQSIEAEQSILGGLLLDNSAWDLAADTVVETDFYRFEHRLIFRAIAALIGANKPADVITVFDQLRQQGADVEDKNCGLTYLNALAQSVPSAANMKRYTEIVRERAVLRKLIAASDETATSAFNPQGRTASQILDDAEARVLAIGEESARGRKEVHEMGELAIRLIDRVTELAENGAQDVTGLRTGFYDIDRQTAGLQAGDLIVLAARPAMGKAQPLDAKVKTPTGWQWMGSLAVGDAVASVDGRPSIVTGVFPQGERQVYRVVFSDGRECECCSEHLWRVHHRKWPEPKILATGDVLELLQNPWNRNRLWIEMCSGDFGAVDDLPIDPWTLGAMIGDGNITGATPLFSKTDPDTLATLRDRIPADMEMVEAGGCTYRLRQRSGGRHGDGNIRRENPLTAAFKSLGLHGLQSHQKFIPTEYLNASKEARLQLMRGLMDTDGWVEKCGAMLYATSSPRLALDFMALARSLGAIVRCRQRVPTFTYKGEKKTGLISFALTVMHPCLEQFVTAPRKRVRLNGRRSSRQVRLSFQSITPSRITETRCISVSHPSRLYLTNDYIVTHNTACALNIAENATIGSTNAAMVFSMEMGADQLALRMIGSQGRIDQQHLRTGRLGADEWGRLTEAVQAVTQAAIYIDETPALSVAEVRARARRQARTCQQRGQKLSLIVVDYIQLMTGGTATSDENRATQLGVISGGLKALAKEIGCPVIALSQLNRAVETRNDKRPLMSDLRESGAIEQDADVIMFIYRDEYYNKESKEPGVAEIIIAKQRNGPVGTVKLSFLRQWTRFENLAPEDAF